MKIIIIIINERIGICGYHPFPKTFYYENFQTYSKIERLLQNLHTHHLHATINIKLFSKSMSVLLFIHEFIF